MSLTDHNFDEEGFHDRDECELCIERNHSVCSSCRCGNCCEGLLLEASLRDAEREPRIKECSPIVDDIRTGERETIAYLLNDSANAGACRFFNRSTRLCTIYETRPLMCRVFDCSECEHADPDRDQTA